MLYVKIIKCINARAFLSYTSPIANNTLLTHLSHIV